MVETQKLNISVSYSINRIGDSPTGNRQLYLHVEQKGPVIAEFIRAIFFVPVRFARHKKLPETNYMNIDGRGYFSISAIETVDDEIITDHKSGNISSYIFTTTWDLPPDFRVEEINEDELIYCDIIACVNPIHQFEKIRLEK